MNILHIDEQMTWRGGEQQASWLMQGLAKLGHRVWLAARPGSAILDSDHGGAAIRQVPAALRGEFDLASAMTLSRLVRSAPIDVLHAHTSHAHTIACLARKFAARGKVAVSRRVSFEPKPHALNRWKYSWPDKFLSVSGRVDEVLQDFGIPESRRAVVYSSVDLARLDVDPIPRAQIGIPDDAPLLLSAGALVGHKDHATLLEAMPAVLAEFPSARLFIAGEGDLRTSVEERIAGLGLDGSIRLLGHRDDVPALIRAADVYVSSSWSEGLGTSVLEALACRIPVVATIAGGVPEMVRDGVTGRLVANRDPDALSTAIRATLRDRAGAAIMANAGRKLVEDRFTVDGMVEGTLRVYESLLNNSRTGG